MLIKTPKEAKQSVCYGSLYCPVDVVMKLKRYVIKSHALLFAFLLSLFQPPGKLSLTFEWNLNLRYK